MNAISTRGHGDMVRTFAPILAFCLFFTAAGCFPEFGVWPADAGGGGEDADHETEPDGDADADGESDGDLTDPCEGVDCSGHGVCYELEGAARCDCELGFDPDTECAGCYPGFNEEDDECVRARECLPTSCGGHGECALNEDGEVECTCWEGFDPDTNCVACLEGYHRIGEECLEDETCPPLDEACSGHGTCDLVNGVANCTCEAGYQGEECEDCYPGYHPVDEGECVRDNSCLDLKQARFKRSGRPQSMTQSIDIRLLSDVVGKCSHRLSLSVRRLHIGVHG